MRGMRQLLTKGQWFLLFNVIAIAFIYLSGNFRFTASDIVSALFALALVNGAALISASKFKDWKK